MRAVLPQESSLDSRSRRSRSSCSPGRRTTAADPARGDRALAREALARTDALQFADRRYPTLSGGERARVMLARVFAQVLRGDEATSAPRALLLVEPSAALDIAHQQSASPRSASSPTRSVAVVAVLHDLNLAAAFADRVALLKDGRLLASGPVADTMTEDVLRAGFSVTVRRLAHPTRDGPVFVCVAGRTPR